jgi:beta-glucanase (GH16 family)
MKSIGNGSVINLTRVKAIIFIGEFWIVRKRNLSHFYCSKDSYSHYSHENNLDQNSATHPVSGADTFDAFHDYTIDWQEDKLCWYIDGTLVRTLNKKDTYDSKSGTYMYPSTPSRIQLSVWNGGDGAEGTKEWSGGAVDWNSADIKSPGYYYVQVANISITCGTTPSGNVSSYVYQSDGSIAYSNAKTSIQPKTPASQGLPDSPGSNVNTMPNMTGQYVLEAQKNNSNSLIIATMATTLFVVLASILLNP